MGRPDFNKPNQAQVQPVSYQSSGTMRKLPQDMQQNSSTMRKLPQNVPPGGVNFQNLWSSGLFDCMNDGGNAVITCLVPCVTFGQIAEIIDEGTTPCATSGLLYGLLFAIGLPCVYSCMFRTKMRNKFGLPEDPAPDWITHLCCEHCALCQVYRELKHRGLDPNIGWNGNVQARQQQEMMAPPTSQRMRSMG